jgi:hypothetical protein
MHVKSVKAKADIFLPPPRTSSKIDMEGAAGPLTNAVALPAGQSIFFEWL